MSDSQVGKPRRRGGRAPIGEEAMGAYISAIRRGAKHEEAARAAGFSRSAFHRLRKRDIEFDAMCEEAAERSAGQRFVRGGNRRRLQLRRIRRLRFTEERKQRFLDHFAGTCNLAEAAVAAEVGESTVLAHLANDPEFAAGARRALAQGYLKLEAELVRKRIEAQQRPREIVPSGALETEFERALKLLQRWERRDGSLGRREVGHGRQRRLSFDDAMALLEKRLRGLDIPIVGEDGTDIRLPPEAEGEDDP